MGFTATTTTARRKLGRRLWAPLATLALAAACGLPACGGSSAGAPAAQDPQRQSESKYDVAKDLWLNRNQPRAALEEALEAFELDDENADAAHLISLIYLQFCALKEGGAPSECRLKEAEQYVRRALEVRETYREARNTLGVILVHQGRHAEAVRVLKPLTEDILYTSPETAWGNLGWAYLEMGKIDHAVDALRRSIASQPNFCVGNYRLGLAFEKKKKLTESVEAFTQALETDHVACKRLQDGWLGRARVRLKLTQAESARSDLEHCVKLGARTKTGQECRSLLATIE